MFHVIGWIVSGLIIGAFARLLMPGRQPMGVPLTILLGIVGSLVGGGISFLIWGGPGDRFSDHAWPGYLLAIVGSMLVLWGVSYSGRRRLR
jgi:uncharacterized membrane protein YeaQ/YmgE (transglycosylase-associated protein family)